MDTVARIFAIGIILAIADNILIRLDKKDIAHFLDLAGIIIVMLLIYKEFKQLYALLWRLL